MKPKYVYLVLRPESLQILGCFYSRLAAEKYADGGAIVQKIGVYCSKENRETIGFDRDYNTCLNT